MAFTLTGTGGLFTRWGAIGKRAINIFTQIGSAFRTEVNTIQNQYESAQQDVIEGLYPALDAYQATPSFVSFAQTMMQDTLIAMGRDDAAPTLLADFDTNLDRLIAQMLSSSDSIAKPTVGSSVAAGGTNIGTGFLMGTTAQGALLDPNDGLAYDYSFAEVITLTCTDDSYTGGGTAVNQESWSAVGYPSADQLNHAWPSGSGTSSSVTTADPDSTSGNLLTNGNFNSWGTPVSNTPDDWDVGAGTPGTTILRGTAPLRSANTYSLKFVGDGAELTTIRQTLTTLLPNTTYALNCWVKSDGAVAAGVLRIRLVDGSNAVVADNASTDNSITRNASAMTSSYVAFNAFFRTPKVMPSTIKLEIGLSTAVTNTEVIDITDVYLAAADQMYTGGPFAKVIPGATAFAKNDTLTLTTTNNATNTQFVRLLDRNFSLRENGKRIPSVGGAAETIPDSLIV